MRINCLITACLVAGSIASAAAVEVSEDSSAPAQAALWDAPNWEAGPALARSKSIAAQSLALELDRLLRDDPAALSARLRALDEADALSWPEREAALLKFTRSLHALRADQVPDETMGLLTHWISRTLVAHEESPSFATPLFNIAAEAQGLQNRWRREAAARTAARALATGAERFLDGWPSADDAVGQAGWIDALRAAPASQRKALLVQGLQRMSNAPQLVLPTTEAAISLRDHAAMTRLVQATDSVSLHFLLTALAGQLTARELDSLLAELITNVAVDRAALAIAIFAPALIDELPFERRMLSLLGDPALGSSAALVLSRRPTPRLKAELEALAASAPTSLLSGRARLALGGFVSGQPEQTP